MWSSTARACAFSIRRYSSVQVLTLLVDDGQVIALLQGSWR